MGNVKKLMMQAAGGDPVYIENVFSTYLYKGTSAQHTITNGIDLSTEGGLVWTKNRDNNTNHALCSTATLVNRDLASNSDSALNIETTAIDQFNTDGYRIGGNATNYNNSSLGYYASWTFRKAPKFFDIVTYTGNGSNRTISHSLGSVPGMIAVKCTSVGGTNWQVYHRGVDSTSPENYRLLLNDNLQRISSVSNWNNTAPTASVFTVGTNNEVNGSGREYVAYVFAHNNNDGGFGLSGDQDIIKCGSIVNASSGSNNFVNLGFEAQWVMIKRYDSTGDWMMADIMRGAPIPTENTQRLFANNTGPESADTLLGPHYNGFQFNNQWGAGTDWVYLAINRNPMEVPTSAGDVFEVDAVNTSATPNYISDFPVDMLLEKGTGGSNTRQYDRIRDQKVLYLDNNWAESGGRGTEEWDHQNGVKFVNSNFYYCWMWKRAPQFFDIVMWEGNAQTTTINHRLGVTPEMIWIRKRNNSSSYGSIVYYGVAANNFLSDSFQSGYGISNSVNPSNISSTTFEIPSGNNEVNENGGTYIAHLFASLDGISKVGTYTGNGGTQTIDCGFSNGAKFVLIKRVSDTGDWHFWDTERGIVASNNDPFLEINTTQQQVSSYDNIDPDNSGFIIKNTINTLINGNGNSYLFYAVAA